MILGHEDYSYEEIWREIGGNLINGDIYKFLKRYKETQSLQNKTLVKVGKNCTISTDDGRIEILSSHDRRTSSEIIQEKIAQCNVMVSARSVRCRLKEFGLNAKIPRKNPFLSLKQWLKRLNWAKT